MIDDIFNDFDKMTKNFGKQVDEFSKKLNSALDNLVKPSVYNYNKQEKSDDVSVTVTETYTDHTGTVRHQKVTTMSKDGSTIRTEHTTKSPTIESLEKTLAQHVKNREFIKAAALNNLIEEMKLKQRQGL